VSVPIVRLKNCNMYKKFIIPVCIFVVALLPLPVYAVDYGFGGSYCPPAASSCLGIGTWNNVHTGGMSCPSGYTDTTINSSFHECWNTITGGSSTTTINNSTTTQQFLTLSSSSTPLQVSSEPLNMFNGMVLFFVGFFGIIWFFRKRI